MKFVRKLVGGAAIVLSAAASAPVPQGPPEMVDVVNDSAATLECHAIAGHWYGFDLGDVAAGGRLTLSVRFDRPSGMIAVPNGHGRLVPLQYVYCGRSGDAWKDRAVLPLRAHLESMGGAIHCREQSGVLGCAD